MRSSWALCGSRRRTARRRVGSAESTVSWGLTSIISRLWRSFQRPAERRRQAMLSAREAERPPVSCAAHPVSWILRLGATIDSWAGGSEHLRRLDSGRATRRVPVLVMAIPAAFPAGCHAPIGCRHAAGDVGFWNSFHGRRVTNRYVCWTDGDLSTGTWGRCVVVELMRGRGGQRLFWFGGGGGFFVWSKGGGAGGGCWGGRPAPPFV